MKKILILLISIVLVVIHSCRNEDWEFPDFDYTTVYFPYQYPIRTLVLGDYETADNTNDNNLTFIISAHIGGIYENTKNHTVNYEIVPTLAESVVTSLGDSIRILPPDFYTLNPVNQFIIPKGKFYAGFEVQLNDAFLNDTMAHKISYVVPVRITSSSLDSVLSGRTDKADPDPRIAGDWEVTPKDFTLFGIKYINPYHGKYLYRGQSIIKNEMNETLETITYRQPYVEFDEIRALTTVNRNTVTLGGTVRQTPVSPGSFQMDLTFDDNNNCSLVQNPASDFPVTGTGKFVKDGDMWGNKPRNAIHLDYQIVVGTNTHYIKDTLVIRDRDVRFEEFVPVVY